MTAQSNLVTAEAAYAQGESGTRPRHRPDSLQPQRIAGRGREGRGGASAERIPIAPPAPPQRVSSNSGAITRRTTKLTHAMPILHTQTSCISEIARLNR